ncbi:hypothetical protein SAMN05192574_12153 [Mucilaginibacter gossypiicola]|uniref:Toprim-like n=1 Tax=Mucilaginibacter gossypiicola TaxID=551995 RepID=A0A1H8UZA9_9SPHI|nr:DUF6371 domain-containing protein [Mucilaginibacter gossypiicola]SEP08552.1 hypothetical protein SAMN05192574_12153 [Mucilaginibacter gossypiicola]
MRYRFSLKATLGRSKKYECPQCGHKNRFTRYTDNWIGEYIADDVGMCDRINSCGYHYRPLQYFQALGKHLGYNPIVNQRISKPVNNTPSYIQQQHLGSSLRRYEKNSFVKFLNALFPASLVDSALERYKIGTSYRWGGSTIFWQIDQVGKIRTGKIMQYDEATGKRIKESSDHIYWMHRHLNLNDFNLEQCLFGEHLLSENPLKTVCVVESEKNAIISSIYDPDCVWVSVGSINNLNVKFCKALKGRKVLLFPDGDAYENWVVRAEELKSIADVSVCDLLEKALTIQEKKQGFDLADYLLPAAPYLLC